MSCPPFPAGLVGAWDGNIDLIVKHLEQVDRKYKNTVRTYGESDLKKAADQLYGNVRALAVTILYICRTQKPECPAQAVGCLMRTLIEACAAVFVFCRNPPEQARRFLGYEKVNTYKTLLLAQRNPNSPFFPSTRGSQANRLQAWDGVKADLATSGSDYLRRKKRKAGALEEGLMGGKDIFCDKWHGEGNIVKIFAAEDLGGFADVMYHMLCAAVHSDVWAQAPFGGTRRSAPAMFAVELWGCAALRLCEALKIQMGADRKFFLRKHCLQALQDERKAGQ